MIEIILYILVLVGESILIASLFPVNKVLKQLPLGNLRNWWFVMAGLIVTFIIGYSAYLVFIWNHAVNIFDLIVPGIFFFGSVFVWMSCSLSLKSVNYVRRVTMLEQENITDTLYGIYNRRYLDRRLVDELERSGRYHLPLSVLLIDVDCFKDINDTFGHQAGDQILIHISKLTLAAVRGSDIITRYGGDEFMIIAPNTPISEAGTLAERLRCSLESDPPVATPEPGKQQVVPCTVSIGVAGYNRETTTPQLLFKHADQALYRAKQAGRNQVVIYSQEGVPEFSWPGL